MELQTTTTMNLPVPLTQERKAEIGQRMSDVKLLIHDKEEQKKNITASYSEQIKSLEFELYGLAKQFHDNAVNAEIECRVEYNTPERGQKTITRLDTNETVKVYDMSEYEVNAIEQPDLFDPQNTNFPLRVFASYGIDIDRIPSFKSYPESIFVVRSMEDLTEHGIDSIDEELFKEVKNCLALQLQREKLSEIEKNELIRHCFVAETDGIEYSWYFFPQVNPDQTEEETNDTPQIKFNPETMDKEDVEQSYSGDVLTKNKIRGFFQIEGKDYVNVGGNEKRIYAYQLVEPGDYKGETHPYEDHPGSGYKGQLIKYRKKEFVLTNPIEVVFESEVVENYSEYEMPENN